MARGPGLRQRNKTSPWSKQSWSYYYYYLGETDGCWFSGRERSGTSIEGSVSDRTSFVVSPIQQCQSTAGNSNRLLYHLPTQHGYLVHEGMQGPDLQNILRFIIYDCRKFIVRSTYDSDERRAKISLRNIVSWLTRKRKTTLRLCKWVVPKKSFVSFVRCFAN